jgi:hypothetical protein
MIKPMCLTILCVSLLAAEARAGFILSVVGPADPVAIPGVGTNEFTVAVRLATDAGTQAIKGYTIPVDLRPPNNTGLPVGWTIDSVNQQFFGFTDPFPGFDKRGGSGDLPSQEGDATASNGNLFGPAVNFTTTPVTLFNLKVRIDPTAAAGDTIVAIFNSGTLLAINDATANPVPSGDLQFQSATITISAVPEPGSLLFSAALGLGVLCRASRSAGGFRRVL